MITIINYRTILRKGFYKNKVMNRLSNNDTPEREIITNAICSNISDKKILGVWEGDFFGDLFILNFSEEGIMTEVVNGESQDFTYSFKNGSFSIIPPTSALNDIMGEDIGLSIINDNNMIIKCELWHFRLRRK